ncbi:uncharacterized protein BDCG_09418 [Blastomyces dermatitidis ER-3]|uniref:Uncharacterized protein n=2 Tax=Ajellomyces dermatitidis TaxID=5039 RepID=F2TNI1_AJEDA|nr:uncharacterized protein BDCG_09418 [Blastomyces dermatitidis ER-3]EEQ86149.2 hypothetical protein BDCG_09418 [Blastomyces dermatitidis ER-3]EGE84794.2 hypothetical protein BDDG_07739 [Blastomyces dermatitidis ATCC 18188]EQL30600.1 hypothetical protein BDFG_06987 [Blastomyces dermatitidis ATCC 26199]
MARAFSSTARTLVRWLGYDKELLTPEFQQALDLIRHRNDGSSPVHPSQYHPNDKELIISARIKHQWAGSSPSHL